MDGSREAVYYFGPLLSHGGLTDGLLLPGLRLAAKGVRVDTNAGLVQRENDALGRVARMLQEEAANLGVESWVGRHLNEAAEAMLLCRKMRLDRSP